MDYYTCKTVKELCFCYGLDYDKLTPDEQQGWDQEFNIDPDVLWFKWAIYHAHENNLNDFGYILPKDLEINHQYLVFQTKEKRFYYCYYLGENKWSGGSHYPRKPGIPVCVYKTNTNACIAYKKLIDGYLYKSPITEGQSYMYHKEPEKKIRYLNKTETV